MSHTSQPTPTAKKYQQPQRQRRYQATGDKKTHRAFGTGNAADIDAQQTGNEGQGQKQYGSDAEAIHQPVHALVQAPAFRLENQIGALANQLQLLEIAGQAIIKIVSKFGRCDSHNGSKIFCKS